MNDKLKLVFAYDMPDDVTMDEISEFSDAVAAANSGRFGKRMSRVTATRDNTVDVGFDA